MEGGGSAEVEGQMEPYTRAGCGSQDTPEKGLGLKLHSDGEGLQGWGS